MIKPKMLQKGDTVAVIAPSSGLGGLCQHRVDNAKRALEGLGFRVKEFPTARKSLDGTAGTVEERTADVHAAFADKDVKAVICTIGGLAANELLTKIDYKLIRSNPKIFCGYSDISNLHYAFHRMAGLVTFYGPAAMTQFGEFPKPFQYTVDRFLKAVSEKGPIGKIAPSAGWTDETLDWFKKEDLKRPRKLQKNGGYVWLKNGSAEGPIIGGCLYSILQLKGTKFDVDYKNKMLFIETSEGQDFKKGEPLNYVNAQLGDLENAGVFDKIRGLIVGRGFGYSKEEREKFRQMILAHVKEHDFPVLSDADIGHTDPIITVPLGVRVSLDSEKGLFSIDESGVV